MKYLNILEANSHWLLRITLTSVFLYHGVLKFTRLEGMSEFLQLPVIVILLVALAEAAGGALVLLGGFVKGDFAGRWMTRLGALMIIPVMIGAIAMVHWGQWNFVPADSHPLDGMQFQVTLLLISLYFVIRGNKA